MKVRRSTRRRSRHSCAKPSRSIHRARRNERNLRRKRSPDRLTAFRADHRTYRSQRNASAIPPATAIIRRSHLYTVHATRTALGVVSPLISILLTSVRATLIAASRPLEENPTMLSLL